MPRAPLLCSPSRSTFPHLLYGGWYSDDWGLANLYHFAPGSAFIHTIEVERATFGNRPLLWVDKALMFAVLGMHARAQLALAVALAVLVAVGFFAVLRMLGAGNPSFGDDRRAQPRVPLV